jgi:Secretion system C-terminal sorting domain
MRRIFTSLTAFACLVAISFNSFGQTCSVSTTNPNPTPAFGQTLAINSGNGFSTPATPASAHQTTLGTWDKGDADQLFSPIYYYNSSQSTIYFKYDLSLPSTGSVSPSYTITIIYGANGAQSFTCSGTWGSVTPITNSSTTYYFSISGISMPASTNFRIVLSLATTNSDKDIVGAAFQANAILATAGAALPVKFSTFEVTPSSTSVSLKWMVATEQNLSGYSVEKSADGRNFTNIGFVNAIGDDSYSFVDTKASATTYYRIKSVDVDGRFSYSTVAMVKAGKSIIVLKAFPMPVIKTVSIQHGTAAAGSLITISSEDGRMIKSVNPAVGTQQTDIDLSSAKAGLYLVRFTNASGEAETLKIVKQ